MNYLIMNSEGRFWSQAGASFYWVTSESEAAVYETREDAVITARFIEINRVEFGLPDADNVQRNLSPLFIEETPLPATH